MKRSLALALLGLGFAFAIRSAGPVFGSPTPIERLNATIDLPQGWEVDATAKGQSLVAREPDVSDKKPGVTYYRRNLTVLAMNEPAPIDEARMQEFLKEVEKNVGAQSTGFQILESKLMQIDENRRAIVVFTQLKIGEDELMQIHALMSGSEKQAVVSFTDLKSRFNDEASYGVAWAAMMSLALPGQAPDRYVVYIQLGVAVMIMLTLVFVWRRIRFRKFSHSYAQDSDIIYSEGGELAVSHMSAISRLPEWKLSARDEYSDDELMFSNTAKL